MIIDLSQHKIGLIYNIVRFYGHSFPSCIVSDRAVKYDIEYREKINDISLISRKGLLFEFYFFAIVSYKVR